MRDITAPAYFSFLISDFSFPLHPTSASKQPIEGGSNYDRGNNHQGEAPPRCFHAIDQVHPEDAGDKRGEHQDDGNGSHLLHDARHIIINNGGIGFHR